MSALAQTIENPIQPQSVTTISATARVDYILRFSKQAVMVIDEQISFCSDIGSQFLANLAVEQNAAYITMSAKLNDLQVRCRIIEQLFGNTLFDPEQSVAVSLINLVKQNKQAVSIVIDNAQHLSLQLIHELAQLAEIAKKADYHINVLMLATPQAGMVVSQNQSLFHKKLSIISAKTGQLIALNAKLFNTQSTFFKLTPLKKWLMFFSALTLVSAITVGILYQRDVFNFSKDILNGSQQHANKTGAIAITSPTFANESSLTGSIGLRSNKTTKGDSASVEEIYLLLNGQTITPTATIKVMPEKAEAEDILNALVNFDIDNNAVSKHSLKISQAADVVIEDDSHTLSTELLSAAQNTIVTPVIADLTIEAEDNQTSTISKIIIDELNGSALYLNQQQGYVIQISGFTQQEVLNEFLADYNEMAFHQYQRLVNDSLMTILTSKYFPTRELAELAYIELPQTIKDRSPWIKEISTINSEINYYQRSQSIKNQVTIPTS